MPGAGTARPNESAPEPSSEAPLPSGMEDRRFLTPLS
jgi:hypothetical protein